MIYNETSLSHQLLSVYQEISLNGVLEAFPVVWILSIFLLHRFQIVFYLQNVAHVWVFAILNNICDIAKWVPVKEPNGAVRWHLLVQFLTLYFVFARQVIVMGESIRPFEFYRKIQLERVRSSNHF